MFTEPDVGITATITLAEIGAKTEVTIYQVCIPERFPGHPDGPDDGLGAGGALR